MKRSISHILAVLALAWIVAPATAQIPVTSFTDDFDAFNNGTCSLREAIALAHADFTDRGCGVIPHTQITLGPGVHAVDTVLPPVFLGVRIEGASAATSIIRGPSAFTNQRTLTVFGVLGLQDLQLLEGHDSGGGGQIAIAGGTVEANRVIFREGAALAGGLADANGGGCINVNGGSAVIHNSVFDGCSTPKNGGAVQVVNGSAALHGITMINNVAALGSVVSAVGGFATVDSGVARANIGSTLNGLVLANLFDATQVIDPEFEVEFTDLRLKDSSPFVEVGSVGGPTPIFGFDPTTTDIAGSTRVQGGAADRGAFETMLDLDYGDAPDPTYATLAASDGARHLIPTIVTHRLGALVDSDTDAHHNGDATGDDTLDASDDEDGVVFLTSLVDPVAGTSTASLEVTTYGDGFLYAWLDLGLDGAFDDPADEVITAAALGSAATTEVATVAFSVPSSATAGTSKMRVRFCSAATSCDEPTGYATDGEVEDYEIEILATGSAASVQLSTTTTATGDWTVQLTGGGAFQVVSSEPLTLFEVPALTDVSELTITGTTAADVLHADYGNGNMVPGAGLTFNGGDGGDELEIDLMNHDLVATRSIVYNGGDPGTGPGDFLTVENSLGGPIGIYGFLSTHVDEDSGTFIVDNEPTSMPADYDDLVITYDGLEPIFFTATPIDAEFHFNDDSNEIFLNGSGDAGGLGNGFSFIDCTDCGESVTFVTPTDSLIVRPGDGDDTITFPNLDVAGPVTLGVLIEGDPGADLFIVTPSPFYDPHIDGEDPVLPQCYGDTLDLVTEGGITDHSLVYTSIGVGRWEFLAASNQNVTFHSIETQLDARTDIEVEVIASDSLFYPTDPIELQYRITNTGFEHATCVSVDISIPDAVNPTEPIVPSRGIFHAPDSLLIGWLQAGVTATMDVVGIIDAHIHDSYLAAASGLVISIDSIAANNADTVRVELLPTFPFPAKAHALDALQVNLPNGLERVMVGLANGSPGLSTGLLCRIPDPDGVLFTQVGVGNRWRPCGDGLPYPIYVTDLFLDDNATPADSSDDRVWLGTWGSEGLYVSDDFGESFVSAAASLPGEAPGWQTVYAMTEDASGIFYLSANNGIIFRSFDRGATWQRVNTLPGASADTPWALTTHPTEAGVLYAGLFGRGVYISLDYGFTWAPLGGSAVNNLLVLEDAGHVFELEFSPDSDEYLFAATGKGVWRVRLDTDGNIAGLWDEIDIRVTLDDGSIVTPEIRTIAFDADADDSDDDMAAGSWGFGAFGHTAPLSANPVPFTPFALREGDITVLLPTDGGFMVGDDSGTIEVFSVTASATSTSNEAGLAELPTEYALDQNYPNPFNPVTTIGFALPQSGDVRLAVFDMLGREVALLVSAPLSAGRHQVQFDAADLPSGTYLYQLRTAEGSFTRQLVLMK